MTGKTSSAARTAARRGLFVALALILGYVESMIPPLAAVPGMKLGLSNLAVLAALYLDGSGAAFVINLVRITLSAVLFGSGASFVYSLAGGMLSAAVMILLKKRGKFGIPAVSTAGGISHNVGQILAAMWLSGAASVRWYLAILWLSGLASGLFIGLSGSLIIGRIKRTAVF